MTASLKTVLKPEVVRDVEEIVTFISFSSENIIFLEEIILVIRSDSSKLDVVVI